jgi:hypothetical protein
MGSTDASVQGQITTVRWTGVRIQVWGKPFTGVPATHEHLSPLLVSSILYGDPMTWRASVWHGSALP